MRKKLFWSISKHDRLTKQQAAELLEVSASTATRLLKRMVESHMLKRNGKARKHLLHGDKIALENNSRKFFYVNVTKNKHFCL